MLARARFFAPAVVNRQHPLARGLVSFHIALPGKAAGATWCDVAGFNHVTLSGLPAGYGFQASTRPGGFGAALKMDGVAAHNASRTASLPVVGLPVTFACWYRPVSAAATNALVDVDNGASGTNGIFIYQQSTGKIGAYIEPLTSVTATTTTVTAGNWQFAAASFAQNAQAVYLNGGGKSTGADTHTPSGLTTFRIGPDCFGNALSGQIDCCMVYNRVLADAEIMALYLETKSGCPRLLRGRSRPVLGYPTGGKFKSEQLAFAPLTGMY